MYLWLSIDIKWLVRVFLDCLLHFNWLLKLVLDTRMLLNSIFFSSSLLFWLWCCIYVIVFFYWWTVLRTDSEYMSSSWCIVFGIFWWRSWSLVIKNLKLYSLPNSSPATVVDQSNNEKNNSDDRNDDGDSVIDEVFWKQTCWMLSEMIVHQNYIDFTVNLKYIIT